ncbi:HEPN domain-containing protein [Rhizobium sp. RCC_161_2]|uniref:HEPN domain-containing protein n=1 Tax=Rhizobium sp. RCC_161_2 TaxID=3239219 RepID=UPI003523234D
MQNGRGRRHEQDALHRAGVVLTIAAWQAYIEKLVGEALDIIDGEMRSPQLDSPQWAIHTFQLRRTAILNAVKKFNTPDDDKVRDLLLEAFGFNRWASWEWRVGPRQGTVAETRRRTNTWVLVRHSIAHGFNLPSDIDWLQGGNGQARLTLGLLMECRKHFVFLAAKTDAAFAAHLTAAHSIASPW